MKNLKIAKKIPSYYVADDCLQEMIGYRGGLWILSPDEILYQDIELKEKIHKYLTDERRHQFPYSNIPTHYQKVLFKEYKFANQILDFNTPYLYFSPKGVFTQQAIKDGKDGIVLSELISVPDKKEERLLTREEFDNFFDYDDDKTFVYKGNVVGKLLLPNVETILEFYKRDVRDIMQDNYNLNCDTEPIIESLISNLTVSSIPSNYQLLSKSDIILMVTGSGQNMKLEMIDLQYMNEDCYKIISRNIPINLYTLEQIRNLKMFDSKEPTISLRLNPQIQKSDLIEAKQMVKSLRRK